MKKFKSLLTLVSAVFVLACVNVSVSGQVTDEDPKIASISAGGSVVRWQVNASYVSMTINVAAPDGQVFRKQLKEGSVAEFALFDKEGKPLADGVYSYELRLTQAISSDVKAKLAASRVNTDDDAATEREMRKIGALPTALVQSGSFTIVRGAAIVPGSAVEGDGRANIKTEPQIPARVVAPTTARRQHHRLLGLNPDQVIPDDLIVQGSLCVGLDCVNNESFGFDTIRLKENNTRIKFEDTSVGSFPTNDWQLTANDSASGGQSKFSIEDITGARVPFTVEAGSTTNSIYVDSTGRVGFRTSTPVLDLHVNTANTPALRLEQNSSGGFTAQTWDVAGNEANFFVRDVTSGSRLPFRIRPGAPTSSLDISADGDVGVGTAGPDAQLHVLGSAAATVSTVQILRVDGNISNGLDFGVLSGSPFTLWMQARDNTNTGLTYPLALNPSGGNVGIGTTAPTLALSVSGDANKSAGGGSWQVFSDERLKDINGSFTSGLKAVMQLQPLRFEYKRDNALGLKSEREQIGFGAQALQKVIPEAVTTSSTGYLQVNNDPILWTMLNAIKEQQKEIEQLKAEVRKLRTTSRRRR